MKNAQKRPCFGVIKNGWRKILLGGLIAAYGLEMGSCGPTQHLPSNPVGKDSTYVHYIDSVRWEIKDSVRITEATKYKDMAWLGDSLKIEGQHSRMWAVADTAKAAILGGLEEDKIEEKTRIIYKERIQYRDSIRYVEKPVPYEVEKEVKYIPWIYKVLSVIGLLWIVILIIKLIVKIKTMGIIKV